MMALLLVGRGAILFFSRFFFAVQRTYCNFAGKKEFVKMKKILSLVGLIMLFGAMAGCQGEKKTKDIITHKPIIVRAGKPQKMGDYSQSRQIVWSGNAYTIEVSFKADPALPLIEEGSQKFYDNRITLRIVRKDGTEFFSKTFTKADFAACLNSDYGRDGALLGIVFDRIAGGQLVFAASVGSPDKSSDEFVPLVMKISRFGEVSVSEDTQLDTNMREGGSAPASVEDEDDGV